MKQVELNTLLVKGVLRRRYYIVREYGLVEILKQPVAKETRIGNTTNKLVKLYHYLVAKVKSLLKKDENTEEA